MSSLSSYLGHLLKQYFLIVWYILNTVLNGRLPWWLRWLKKKKNLPAMWETWVQSLGWEDPLRRAWQPTPVFLPGESPWTEELGGLQSMGSQEVGHH